MDKVSIIILNYNGINYTLKCLESLRRIDYDNYEIIVVDNGSKDNSLEILRKINDIRLIENPKNLGFAEGNNIGFRQATGKYIALLNSDTIVSKNWLKELIKGLESDKKIGTVGPLIYNKYDGKSYTFMGYETVTLLQFHTLMKNISKKNKKNRLTFGNAACSVVFRKSSVEKPFDPDYFAYAEDTYLAWLLLLKGYHHIVVPKSTIKHEYASVIKGSKKIRPFVVYLGERNRLLNHFLFYETKTLLKLLPPLLISTIIFNLYDYKNIIPKLRAYAYLLIYPLKIYKKRRKIQQQRKVPDSEIIKLMSYKMFDEGTSKNKVFQKIITLLNRLSFWYCKALNLKTIEFHEN